MTPPRTPTNQIISECSPGRIVHTNSVDAANIIEFDPPEFCTPIRDDNGDKSPGVPTRKKPRKEDDDDNLKDTVQIAVPVSLGRSVSLFGCKPPDIESPFRGSGFRPSLTYPITMFVNIYSIFCREIIVFLHTIAFYDCRRYLSNPTYLYYLFNYISTNGLCDISSFEKIIELRSRYSTDSKVVFIVPENTYEDGYHIYNILWDIITNFLSINRLNQSNCFIETVTNLSKPELLEKIGIGSFEIKEDSPFTNCEFNYDMGKFSYRIAQIPFGLYAFYDVKELHFRFTDSSCENPAKVKIRHSFSVPLNSDRIFSVCKYNLQFTTELSKSLIILLGKLVPLDGFRQYYLTQEEEDKVDLQLGRGDFDLVGVA